MDSKNKFCFIVGIMPRSGTNYLFNSLNNHDAISGPGPLWEDFLLANTHRLSNFIKSISRSWKPSWDQQNLILDTKHLKASMGEGFKHYLSRQNFDSNAKYCITKTPSVKNISSFFDYFPNEKLIIIIRDGRSVVASGEKTFNWDFEKASRDWAYLANTLIKFAKDNEHLKDRFKIIRYEDLFTENETTLKEVFAFLDITIKDFSFEETENLYVSGSSETITDGSMSMHWDHSAKTKDFNPLTRYESWSLLKKIRYYHICKKEMAHFNYQQNNYDGIFYSLINGLFIITWPFRAIPRTLYHAIVHKRLILKTY